MGCKCHGATFCPDLICVDMEDDVPVFVRRDSPEGRAAVAREARPAAPGVEEMVGRLRSLANALIALRQGVTLEAAQTLPVTNPVTVADAIEEAADMIERLGRMPFARRNQ